MCPFNDEEKIHIFVYTLKDVFSSEGKAFTRTCKVAFSILYHGHQLFKNIIRGKWSHIFCSVESFAKGAKVSKRSAQSFFNSKKSSLFMDVIPRPHLTNVYVIEPWVIEVFDFFEKMGLMRGFRTNFKKWYGVFMKRIKNHILPMIAKGLSFKDILDINKKLSTKVAKQFAPPEPNNLHGIKISSNEDMSSIKLKSLNLEQSPPGFSLLQGKLFQVCNALSRLSLKERDIFTVANNFSISDLMGALRESDTLMERGSVPKDPKHWVLYSIKKHRENKKYYRANFNGSRQETTRIRV